METASKRLSLKVVILFGIAQFLLVKCIFSATVTMYPEDSLAQSCQLSSGKEGVCIYGYLCKDNMINIDGDGIIDLRYSDVCEDYFLKCCSTETPCLENQGTCVSASNCGVSLKDPKYKKFNQTDECDWSGYQCCPTNKIGQTFVSNQTERELCDEDSYCVPLDKCKEIAGGAQVFDCSSKDHTCCHESRISELAQNVSSISNSIEQYEACDDHTVCVPDDQCLVKPDGINIMQERISICSGVNQTCCPKDKVKISNPCNEIGGTCKLESSCAKSSILKFNIRLSQCDEPGFVCCMDDADENDEFINRVCFNNLGKCKKEMCPGTKYTDRKNDCGGLNCCAIEDLNSSESTEKTTAGVFVASDEGMVCNGGNGVCTKGNCIGEKYSDYFTECGDLNCCAKIQDPETDTSGSAAHSCKSIGGKCMLHGKCYHKTDSPVKDCGLKEVCCLQGNDEIVKDCGYRNQDGVKFETTNREGGESQFGEFPWMVAIMINENNKLKYLCGGSLIDPEVVLTSAKCVKAFKSTPGRLIIRAGEWDMGSTSEPIRHEELNVAKIKSHPNFKSTTLINNIALLFLEDKFDLIPTINTVCLPPQDFVIDNGEVTASGWGSTPLDRTKYQQILKSIDLQFIERSNCEQILRKGMGNHNFKLHRSFICAGGVAGVDTCIGDAGSPVVFPVPNEYKPRYYAVGMVSWGIGCGRAGMAAAYTDIAFFREWIDNEMEKEGLHSHYYSYTRQEEDDDQE